MKLYSYWRSSCSYRVRIALELKGVAYEYVPVDIAPSKLQQDVAAFGGVNPLRQVPTLEWAEGTEKIRLTQSVAIIEYLEERFPSPSLLPEDVLERARVREAVEIVNSGIQPLQNSKTLSAVRSYAGDEGAQHWAREVIHRGLEALETKAKRSARPFFLGASPTVADVFIVPQLYNARRVGLDTGAYPALSELARHAGRLGAFERARPEHQPDAPRDAMQVLAERETG